MTLFMNVFQNDVIIVVYFFISKTILTTKKEICDRCYKILLNTEFEPIDIRIIWLNNCKYRVLTNLRRGQVQRLMEREKITYRYSYIDISNINPNEI